MPSILPDFEYDIFISYRHNDNRSGGITSFVNHLKEELAATLKTPLSIYFDTNQYDGLMENHDVDKSLAIKLNSLIFIPIISQTYCDPGSFAWQHEFCAFNQIAMANDLGRDIKLNNGNVASRILPIKIHDLDAEDIQTLEAELSSVLRSIDFIYRDAGVNRPLQIDDKKEDNLYRLSYRNQINKVANAIKDIVNGIRYPDRVQTADKQYAKQKSTSKEANDSQEIKRNSIAVLPFRNLSHDPTQEYFADGITESILMTLGTLKQLKVISRTSVMRYKNTDKTAPEIAADLRVNFILEGSAQVYGNQVRISAQLIDARHDETVWSKMFLEDVADVFAIQNKVAETVADELRVSLNKDETDKLKEVPTNNMEAYDLFLKGMHAFNQWGVAGYRAASDYFKQAIDKDANFQQAYSFLASSYSARMSWNGDLSPAEALQQLQPYLDKACEFGATDNDYLTRAFVAFFINKDFSEAENMLQQAIDLNPNNAITLYTYSYVLNMMGRFEEAMTMVTKAKAIDPLTVAYFNYQSISLYLLGDYDQALDTLNEALRLYPAVLRFYDYLGRVHLTSGNYEQAVKALEKGLSTTHLRPPSMLAYLGAANFALGKKDLAKQLLHELEERSKANEKGVNFYVTHLYHAMEDPENARFWLKKAHSANDIDLIWIHVDPLLATLDKNGLDKKLAPEFNQAEEEIINLLEEKLPPRPYHNLGHIRDVMQAAEQIAASEKISPEELPLVRLAALFHDAGFIYQAKGHEAKSVGIARELLPKQGLTEEQIEAIGSMIMATKLPQKPTNQLDEILCDANLDYLGRDDFWEISNNLFLELQEQGVVETKREWNLVQKTFLESHQYHTDFGRNNRAPTKDKNLQEIISQLNHRN